MHFNKKNASRETIFSLLVWKHLTNLLKCFNNPETKNLEKNSYNKNVFQSVLNIRIFLDKTENA